MSGCPYSGTKQNSVPIKGNTATKVNRVAKYILTRKREGGAVKNLRWLAVLSLIAALLGGCLGGSLKYGSIVGSVYFRDVAGRTKPAVSVEVSVDGKRAYTGNDGSFQISGIRAGIRQMVIEPREPNYSANQQSIEIQAGKTLVAGDFILSQQPYRPGYGAVAGYVYIPKQSQYLAMTGMVEALFADRPGPPPGYEPLVGATVSIGWERIQTDRTGYFGLSGVRSGPVSVSVADRSLRFPIEREVNVPPGGTAWIGRYEEPPIYAGIGYYLVVGIGKYPGEDRVPGAAENAGEVYDALFQRNRLAAYGRKLLDKEATKDTIETVLRGISEEAWNPEDYLVIYFSGKSGADYLSPSDDDGSSWRKVITDTELEEWLRQFPGTVTVIIDGTDSASMADGNHFRPYALKKRKYTVLSAAKKGEEIFYEPSLGGSVFTHFLLRGIKNRGADGNRNGDITAKELYDYINDEMQAHFNNWRDPDSHRPVLHEGDYVDAVVFRYR